MPSKFAIENENVLQLLGDFVPQTPYRGSAPGPGGLPSPRQLTCAVQKFPLKSPASRTDYLMRIMPWIHKTSHAFNCIDGLNLN